MTMSLSAGGGGGSIGADLRDIRRRGRGIQSERRREREKAGRGLSPCLGVVVS